MAKIETVSYRTNVAIVDDDEDIRLSLKDILQSTGDFNFAGGFSNAGEALARLPDLRPDLTLMDIRLPDLNGIECTKRLKRAMPFLKIIILTGIHEVSWVDASLKAGAAAFLVKPFHGHQLLAALSFASKNEAQLGRVRGNRVLRAVQGGLPLSPRENEVLECLADGLLYKEISDELGISYSAVHKYLDHIYKKLGVSNRSEAIRVWIDNGGS